ncbi:MAG: B12-binding domain-containing radical SAM protein [Desulfobulbus sp.]|nr:MAG: B12-binding domain-containing radical SAM protein [Desulfobulbus sp.]
MNILLISPNTLQVPYPVYPIGLDYVAGSVDGRHRVRIADLNCMDRDELAQLIDDFSPQIIGISCRNIDNTDEGDSHYFIREYRHLVDWLRKRSRAVLVCGGAGFTIMPDRIFAALDVDFGIIGEGERFGLLVEAIDAGRRPTDIAGVIGAGAGNELPVPWPGEQVRAFGQRFSHHRFYADRGGMLNLQTKRGCSFSCIYCPYPRIEGKKHRLQPPDAVAATAMRLQEAGARYIFITDSAFNSDVRHSLAVARALKTAGLHIPWGGFFAPIRLPADYFATMAACGLQHVEFGTESLSPTMLKNYRKPFSPQDVQAAHDQAREAGIHTAHYFLLGGPGESMETVLESLDGIEHLDKAALFFFIGIRIYPWTGLYGVALAEKKISERTDLLQPVFYQPDRIDHDSIRVLVTERAAGRSNWIVGSGGEQSARIVEKLHRRGFTGPLWEYLVR